MEFADSVLQVAADEFNTRERRGDGVQVVAGLNSGLSLLRDLLFTRLHADVERRMGTDSMFMPVSPEKTEHVTKRETDIYQLVWSALAVQEHRYVQADAGWYLAWLGRLRLGSLAADEHVVKRITQYLSSTADQRRLTFSNVLAIALPESRRAPLVLFRLLPVAVQIATALAFGHREDAAHGRHEQTVVQSAICDCHECHGRLLENGEQCKVCGNPLWSYEWLTAS